MRVAAAIFAAFVLAACATAELPADDSDRSVGIRREPCGGGPVFPPEQEPAAAQEAGEPEN